MKTLKCDLCNHEEEGETFEEWMEAMKPHYAQAHADFMKQQEEQTTEEQKTDTEKWAIENKEKMEKWEMENKARFESA